MERVIVIGTSCCGKTTLARRIAEVAQAPHVELDALFWGPDWTEASPDSFRAAVKEQVSGDRWVVDGNYGTVRDLVWSRATDTIWLNYPFRIVFGRALSRTVRRVFLRQELFGGNRESFGGAFLSRESILWWVITTFRHRRKEYRALFDNGAFPGLHLTELRRPKDAEELLKRIQSEDI